MSETSNSVGLRSGQAAGWSRIRTDGRRATILRLRKLAHNFSPRLPRCRWIASNKCGSKCHITLFCRRRHKIWIFATDRLPRGGRNKLRSVPVSSRMSVRHCWTCRPSVRGGTVVAADSRPDAIMNAQVLAWSCPRLTANPGRACSACHAVSESGRTVGAPHPSMRVA